MYVKIALRYLISVRGSSLVITLVAFLGVFLSVCAIILTLGLFTGFQDELKEKILSRSPHIVITFYTDEEEERIREVLAGTREVENFISYRVYSAFLSNGRIIHSVSVKATDLASENFRRFIEEFMINGFPETLLVGKGVAEILFVNVGDELTLVSPFGVRTPTGFIPRTAKYFVKGIFYTGFYDRDYALVYMDLQEARNFFKRDFGANLTEVYLKNPYAADEVKKKLRNLVGESVVLKSWIDLNRPLFNALELEKLGLFVILLLMVLVASFNITSLLFVKVKEKVKDIAILKTYGMESRGILLIFLTVGLSIGLLGGFLGTITAFVLAHIINEYKLIRVAEEVYMMSYIPVHIKTKDVAYTLLGTFVLSLLSSLLPSLKAARQGVIEVLRRE